MVGEIKTGRHNAFVPVRKKPLYRLTGTDLSKGAKAREERVRAAVAERRLDLETLARDLVRFDTTARMPGDPSREEADLQTLLANRLSAAGAEVKLWEPDQDSISPWARQISVDSLSFEGRPQLIARWPGSGGGRSLILNGHIDVVSAEPFSRWSVEPFGGELVDGRLVGRGAVDMKGGIAAMVIAAEAVIAEAGALQGDLIINTVTDEESSGAGALACIGEGLSGDGVIVPEPTGFEVWIACRGSLTPTIQVQGRSGHAELPQADWREGGAVNAIEKLRVVLDAVTELRRTWATSADQHHDFLEPGTIVPVLLEGGEWFVSYPAQAQVTCELMYLPQATDDQGEGRAVEQDLLDWIDRAIEESGDEWLQRHPPAVSWGSDIPPAEIEPSHPLSRTMASSASATGLNGKISGFNSWYDGASFIRTKGIPAIAFGPPETSSAHAIDEGVEVEDLVLTAQALATAALRWCEGA